jgi:hypothetical protein
MKDLSSIVAKFKVQGTIEEIKPLGAGLINDTYKVNTKEADAPDYVLHQSCHFSECRDASIQYYRCHQSYSQETNGGRRIGYRAQGFEFPRNRRGESILVRR